METVAVLQEINVETGMVIVTMVSIAYLDNVEQTIVTLKRFLLLREKMIAV